MNDWLTQYHALLFDLDGTLVDSMVVHNQAWIDTVKAAGHSITPEILAAHAGVPTDVTARLFNERFNWQIDPAAIAAEKELRFLKNLELVKIIEPVFEIAREQHRRGKPMAIVSGGTPEIVDRILQASGLADWFPTRVCAGDVEHGKPAPDPFLYAARLLNVTPEKCLVFEDGEAGIQGAKAAGMAVIRVERDFRLTQL